MVGLASPTRGPRRPSGAGGRLAWRPRRHGIGDLSVVVTLRSRTRYANWLEIEDEEIMLLLMASRPQSLLLLLESRSPALRRDDLSEEELLLLFTSGVR